MNILEVRVDNFSKKEILEKIRNFLVEPKFHQIATINPEFILEAQNNQQFRNILNSCDLNVADGFGIRLAFWRYGQHLKCRLAGADLMLEVLKISQTQKLSVFLAINKNGLSTFKEARDAILKIYPDLIIDGKELDLKIPYQIPASSADRLDTNYQILLCNFGAPYQELFNNSQKCANIRLAMGVGGSFDFLTGKVQRAPIFMQNFGFEWLWRLIQQPKRIKRIFNAVIIFPIKILFNK